MKLLCREPRAVMLPRAMSHRLRRPSRHPVNRVCPSRLQPTHVTLAGCLITCDSGCPLVASQTQAVPSAHPVASSRPPPPYATEFTGWPSLTVVSDFQFSVFQILTVPSAPPVARLWPSGLKATELTI